MGHALGNNYGKLYSFQSKPVILDLQFQVTPATATGVSSLKGQGVSNVYMHTSGSPGAGLPNPPVGVAWIHLAYSYTRMYAGPWLAVAPVTGSALAINATALTANTPYQIATAGVGPTGTATIAPVADVSGSLASTWFRLYDAYGNTFIVYFVVAGIGSAPVGVAGTLVPVQIASGATAAQIGALLVTILGGLTAQQPGNLQAPAAVFSFTATGTTTVTLVSTLTGVALPGVPADGAIATGFTFALTKFGSNLNAWQQVGLPKGLNPAQGQSFISLNTGYATGGGSTGTVQALGNTGITNMEIMGDSNSSLFPQPQGGSPNVGGWIMVQFLAPTSSSVTTLIPTAPTANTFIKMNFLFEQAARVGGNAE